MMTILGLGNPGADYASTRHNSGVMLVDAIFNYHLLNFKDSYGWRRKKKIMTAEFPDLFLVKTADYFMNESGQIIRDLKNSPHPLFIKEGEVSKNFYLAHDDLDIKLGEYKIQFGTGPKVHNGVNSIEEALGTKDFWRIRIGVDNRKFPIDGETYVLQRFTQEEKKVLDEVLKKIADEIIETNSGR